MPDTNREETPEETWNRICEKEDYFNFPFETAEAYHAARNQKMIDKCVFPIHDDEELVQNVVGIISMIHNPNLKTREDLKEIGTIASEMYTYLKNKL